MGSRGESEGLHSVSDPYVVVLVRDVFFTLLWQLTPKQLITMKKKTHLILAVRRWVHVNVLEGVNVGVFVGR